MSYEQKTQLITNRHGQSLYAHLTPSLMGTAKHTVFYTHGRGGHTGSEHNQTIITELQKQNIKIIAIDATNSYPPNSSDGTMDTFSIDNHISDMEDTVIWAYEQNQIEGDIILSGHSMGGTAALAIASNSSQTTVIDNSYISGVFAFAPAISMRQQYDYKCTTQPENMKQGYFEDTNNDETIRISAETMQKQWGNLDLMNHTQNLSCPTYIFAGSDDEMVALQNIQEFQSTLAHVPHSVSVIEHAGHSFDGQHKTLRHHIQKQVQAFRKETARYDQEPPAPS